MTMRKIKLSTYFLKRLKILRKKYPNIMKDVDGLLAQLEEGETPGDRLQGFDESIKVFKVRLPNRDAGRGKSGGYCVIYYMRIDDAILLVLIYSKTEMEDVPSDELIAAIEVAEQESLENKDEQTDTLTGEE
jgi:mRNA-degrading endonuclease RelE of RelBE toxin-antitoxin system